MPKFPLRVAVWLALILLLASAARAEFTETQLDDDTIVYSLTVTPAAEPVPALEYRLVTPPHLLKRGNAPAHYRRAHAENYLSGTQDAMRKKFGNWYDWVTGGEPESQATPEQLASAARLASRIVDRFVRPGTLCRNNEWGLAVEDLRGPESIAFLLPEYQGMREMCRLTALVTRHAILQQRYADAVDLLRMNYRMGRDTGETPFLVCGLIGIAITNITNNNTLELIAAPDSPNLYWALGELPDPVVPLRAALRLEMSLGERMFPLLAEAETANDSADGWNQRWREVLSSFFQMQKYMSNSFAGKKPPSALGELAAVGLAMQNYPHAKQRLVDWGYGAKQVEAMPVGQVMALYSSRVLRLHSQNLEKLWTLPYADARRLGRAFDDELSKIGPMSSHPDREVLPIASTLLPAVDAAMQDEMRSRREIAVLRAIEAVRMHAAATGELPQSLDEVTVVPMPKNPATGQPFLYETEQANFVFGDEAPQTGSATFVLPASDGIVLERRYVIRLAAGE